MGKARRPRKRKDPNSDLNPAEEQEQPQPETQPKGELVPPARRPPTAVGIETPPPPKAPLPVPARTPQQRPVLYEWIQTLRAAVGTMLDIADAAAEAITKRLEGRA